MGGNLIETYSHVSDLYMFGEVLTNSHAGASVAGEGAAGGVEESVFGGAGGEAPVCVGGC